MPLATLNGDFYGDDGERRGNFFFGEFDQNAWFTPQPSPERTAILGKVGPFIGPEAVQQCQMTSLLGQRGCDLN